MKTSYRGNSTELSSVVRRYTQSDISPCYSKLYCLELDSATTVYALNALYRDKDSSSLLNVQHSNGLCSIQMDNHNWQVVIDTEKLHCYLAYNCDDDNNFYRWCELQKDRVLVCDKIHEFVPVSTAKEGLCVIASLFLLFALSEPDWKMGIEKCSELLGTLDVMRTKDSADFAVSDDLGYAVTATDIGYSITVFKCVGSPGIVYTMHNIILSRTESVKVKEEEMSLEKAQEILKKYLVNMNIQTAESCIDEISRLSTLNFTETLLIDTARFIEKELL